MHGQRRIEVSRKGVGTGIRGTGGTHSLERGQGDGQFVKAVARVSTSMSPSRCAWALRLVPRGDGVIDRRRSAGLAAGGAHDRREPLGPDHRAGREDPAHQGAGHAG